MDWLILDFRDDDLWYKLVQVIKYVKPTPVFTLEFANS